MSVIKNLDNIILALVFTVLIFCAGGGAGKYFENKRWEREAVKTGKAEYVADPETGRVIWMWK